MALHDGRAAPPVAGQYRKFDVTVDDDGIAVITFNTPESVHCCAPPMHGVTTRAHTQTHPVPSSALAQSVRTQEVCRH